MMKCITIAAALLAITTGAEARHHQHYAHHRGHGHHGQANWHHGHRHNATSTQRTHRWAGIQGYGASVGHPPGCPGRAFCGCGASVRVFGHPVRSLYLAANWLRFPRAAPAPGMVAARRGHVFVLEQQMSRGLWMVYDANSGGHATRVHLRSLTGYAIVNPRI